MYTLDGSTNHTLICFERPMSCLSWAPHNGGRKEGVLHALNRTLPKNELRTLRGLQADLIQDIASYGAKPETTVGMLTTVPQQYLGLDAKQGPKDLLLTSMCTVGLGNAMAPGEHAAYDEETGSVPATAGTINIILLVNRCLSDCAALELSNAVSLAKASIMAELGLVSRRNQRLKLGTGTDCNAIFWQTEHQTVLQYAGMHTRLAELAANAVRAAMLHSLALRLDITDLTESKVLSIANSRLNAS